MDLSDKKRLLAESLRREGYLNDPKIVRAFMDVPREVFVSPDDSEFAYSDQPLNIGYGQTISAPHMVAIMTELLEPGKEDVVMEIGGGSGYQAAVLASLVKQVYTIELVPRLCELAKSNLKKAGISNVSVIQGDGSLGYLEKAPYDKILVACGTDSIYPAWKEQLREGGILLAPVNAGNHQELILSRKAKGTLEEKRILSCSFVPLRH